MSTVHICLNDILGVAVAGCEVIFYPGDTPFFNGSALTVSGARSIRLDAEGNGNVTLLAGCYSVRFSGITGNTDTLLIEVPSDAESYDFSALICGGNWVLPMRDFLQKSKNLGDVADPVAAFAAIKQAATESEAGVVLLAKLLTVSNAAARLALTAAQVNRFDEVEQLDTRAVYQVLDTTLLAHETGWLQIGTRAATEGSEGGSSSLLTDLVGYWKLHETSGVRADSTSSGNDLSDNNGVGCVAGKIGNAANFDGTNYLNTADLSGVMDGQSFTVAFWAKFDPSAQSGTPGLVNSWSGGGAYNLRFVPSGNTLNLYLGGSGEILAAAPTDGTWHHYVVRRDHASGNNDFWIDGVLATSGNSGSIGSWTRGIRIGRADDALVGAIDETGLWKRALTSDEIAALYNTGTGKTYPFTA